ncbi:MAG: glycosyl transferase [Desulfatitalea sp. BRH_c12]|nr:MAG: glycosyl transferase [Desulfatitalea sp. BRH_c12]
MKSATVSVIMAAYNHAGFVKQAIESVLQQRDVEFEFLIADDGSSDRTKEVIASVNDPRIKFFQNDVNRGACFVTNDLIEKASGEFIALINSDDSWIDEYKLAYQIDLMRENPSLGACFGLARFVDKEGGHIKTKLPFEKVFHQENRPRGKWLRHFFDHGNCICHPTMLIRRECYKNLGTYNNRLRQLPDFDMWVRLVKHYEISISHKELVNFRIMPGENASCETPTNSIRTINEHYLIAEKFFDNVNRELLIDGFYDQLIVKDIPSNEHLNIEKALLYFLGNQWLDKPYKMIGLLKLNSLLNDNSHREILSKSYGVDDKWFQNEMGKIDVLRPKIFATASYSRNILYVAWQRLLSIVN